MRGRNEAGEYQGLQRCGDKDCEGGHPEQVRSVVLHILEDNLLCSVATVAPEGRAHVNTAYFCYSDDLELFFLSHPTAVHSQNVSRNASMAMTVFSSSQQWAIRELEGKSPEQNLAREYRFYRFVVRN